MSISSNVLRETASAHGDEVLIVLSCGLRNSLGLTPSPSDSLNRLPVAPQHPDHRQPGYPHSSQLDKWPGSAAGLPVTPVTLVSDQPVKHLGQLQEHGELSAAAQQAHVLAALRLWSCVKRASPPITCQLAESAQWRRPLLNLTCSLLLQDKLGFQLLHPLLQKKSIPPPYHASCTTGVIVMKCFHSFP